MITPSFSLTATAQVLPKLALDFTTALLDSRITFTRTTGASNPATYIDSSGFVAVATNNQPRFDYNPITLVCKGLLIEEARANLCLYSDSLNNVVWTVTRASITANDVISPDNTLNADKLVEDSSASTSHFISPANISFVSGTSYTMSFYAKAGERNVVQWAFSSSSHGANAWVNFKLSTGTIGFFGASVTASSITPCGNGWYRCSATAPATATISTGGIFCLSNSDPNTRAPTYTGNGTSGLYLWGAQLEAGAFATSYIPTTTTALTRNADVATMTGTNFSDWFNASEGTLEVQGLLKGPSNTNPTIAQISDGTTANNMILDWFSNSLRGLMVASGITRVISSGSLSTVGGVYNGVLGYKTNNLGFSGLGATFTPNTTAAVPTGQDRLTIGFRPTSPALYWNSHVQKINYWPQRLTDAELRAFSK